MKVFPNDKNKRIGDARHATKARRKHQIPMSFEFGINLSRTNKEQKEFLFMSFNEAK